CTEAGLGWYFDVW
nr:immunoglobulin heavy chain junction region [Mus musculus]